MSRSDLKLREAYRLAIEVYGFSPRDLLTTHNPKTTKTNEANLGYFAAIMHLFPGAKDICPSASPGCKRACLGITAGRSGIQYKDGRENPIHIARKNRTEMYRKDRTYFLILLTDRVAKHVAKADVLGLKPAIRLNGVSDIAWEDSYVITDWPQVQFHDYTKVYERIFLSIASSKWPKNYDLCFSRSEHNDQECLEVIRNGGNVVCVFGDGKNAYLGDLPEEYRFRDSLEWYPVHDGDKHDLRFLDPACHIIGVRHKQQKGRKERDKSGFVLPLLVPTVGAT